MPMPTAAPAPQPPPAPLGSGLRLAGGAPEESAEASAPAATPQPEAQQAPPAARAGACATQPAPEAEPRSGCGGRALASQELESKLHAVLTERNSLAQSLNELQARLNEAAQAHVAGVNAEVGAARRSAREPAAGCRREPRGARAGAAARGRADRRAEGRLAETAEGRHELDNELELLRTAAADRGAALEQMPRCSPNSRSCARDRPKIPAARLQELAQKRDAAEANAQALAADLAQLPSRAARSRPSSRSCARARRRTERRAAGAGTEAR